MELIALLAFYDETPEFLERYVRGLTIAGVRQLVALDGAYALYPDATALSPAEQRQALRAACAAHGVKLHLHAPLAPWETGEVGKRTRLLRLGDAIAKRGDWLLVLDADEHIESVPDGLLAGREEVCDFLRRGLRGRGVELAGLDYDVAEIQLVRQIQADGPSDQDHRSMHRRIFRARLGLHVESNHSTYVTADGRALWCAGDPDLQEPAADLPGFVVTHMTRHRPQPRHHARGLYYTRRYELNVEPPWSPSA